MAGFEFFSLFLIDELAKSNHLRKRKYGKRLIDPLVLPDRAFVRQFRVSKKMVFLVTEELRPHVPDNGKPLHVRVLVTLRFFATGKKQKAVGEDVFVRLSQMTVSRCIQNISRAIDKHLFSKYVRFPATKEEQTEVQKGFMEKYSFPKVLGVIDSFYIPIQKPSSVRSEILNRRGVPTLKIQLVTDSSLRILGVNSECFGGTDDCSAWYKNEIRDHLLKQEDHSSWLLGDRSFPLEPWILTPFKTPTESEKVFNEKHRAASECIRSCKKVLKSRFCCLNGQEILNYRPVQWSHIVKACAVFHNMCIMHNMPFQLTESVDDDSDDSDWDENDQTESVDGDVNDIINNVGVINRQRVLQDLLRAC